MALRTDQKLLITAAVLSVAVWVVPYARPLLLPLIYFNTHVHEFAHALTAVLTGGQVKHILVFADGSGMAPVYGANLFLTASAGYVGSSIAGCLMILGSRTETVARRTLWITFALLGASMLFFVKGDGIGIASGFLWLGILFLAARYFKKEATVLTSQFLGVSLCLTSLQALLVLLNLTAASPGSHNDAKILQDATMVPSVVWAFLWAAVSLVAMGASLKSAWKPAPQPSRRTP